MFFFIAKNLKGGYILARQDLMEKYSYLLGTKVNKWTVLKLEKAMQDSIRLFAICECECGNIKRVLVKNLVRNLSKDCGCGRKRTISKLFSSDLCGKKFGKLLVLEKLPQDKNGHSLYKCLCDCGNEIILPGYSLSTNHTASCGCLLSYYNMYIDKLLDEMGIEHKVEHVVDIGCKKYRFDFYLPEFNLFIEYDGEQHYKPVRYFSQSDEEVEATFNETKRRDKIKDQYCKENNINLLRIPYWEKQNIKTIINNYLQRLSEKGCTNVQYATV